MSGILCLKWNNHTSTFIKTLDNLRSKELYCDATIACHGKYFPVHRFVLTTCSEYFEEIFERTQCKHPFIIVKDVEELQLEALLNYMYKGEVNVLQDRLPGLIRAAEALKVRGLAVSEEDADEKKPVKEKRKSNSSPLQPKTKRRVTESKSLPVNVPIPDSDDDDISEILHEKSNLPNQNLNPEVSHTENTSDVESIEKSQSGLEENTNVEKEDINGENRTSENEVEDIKVEPSEIFEAVEDDFPSQSMESQSQARGKEESLFVSLLSPNNSHSLSEEDLMAINDTNSQAMPQCSSWSDDVSTNSDKMQDEILMIDDIKIEEQEFFSEPSSPLMMDEALASQEEESSPRVAAQCPLCSYKSQYKTNMKTHIARKHSGEQPFSCSACKYKTSTKESLKIHMRKHTGEKPYKCKFCPYKAAHYNSIKLHTNIHTGEKPFGCPFCSYTAAQKISLFKHMKLHN